jgi:hypothetical protein
LTDGKPSITIHNLINLTGIYAPISVPYEKGGKDFLAWITEQGGLDVNLDGKGDVEVKYLWAETGNDPARFMAAYKRFRMGESRFSIIEMITYPKPRPFIMEMWPSPNQEIKPILQRDGIVALGFGLDDRQLYPPAWNFTDNGSSAESAAGAIEYYIDHLWPNRGKGTKAKVACLTWEKAYGKALDRLMKRHGEKTGKYEVVAELSFATMPTDREAAEILPDLGKKGIDIIWANSTVQTSAAIMKGIHNLGLSKKIVLLANPGAPADDLLNIVDPGSAEGYISVQSVFIPTVEPDEPGVKFARMLNDKYRKDPGLPNALYMQGIRMKANILESARRALIGIMKRDRVDLVKACKRLTGKDVKEFGIQTLAGYPANDTTTKLQSAPAGKDDRRLSNHVRLIGIQGGRVTVLSPWYKLPRLIPEDLIKLGSFKDETINTNYVLVK